MSRMVDMKAVYEAKVGKKFNWAVFRRPIANGHMPYDRVFSVGGDFFTAPHDELCHATGKEVYDPRFSRWWENEYVDSEGGLHYS